MSLEKHTTIRQYKNVMHNVFDGGIKFDKSINNNIIFEKIKKKDVII